jgi:chorismate mutase
MTDTANNTENKAQIEAPTKSVNSSISSISKPMTTNIFADIEDTNQKSSKPKRIQDCNVEELKGRLSVQFTDKKCGARTASVKLGGKISLIIYNRTSIPLPASEYPVTEEDILEKVFTLTDEELNDVLLNARGRYADAINKQKSANSGGTIESRRDARIKKKARKAALLKADNDFNEQLHIKSVGF